MIEMLLVKSAPPGAINVDILKMKQGTRVLNVAIRKIVKKKKKIVFYFFKGINYILKQSLQNN